MKHFMALLNVVFIFLFKNQLIYFNLKFTVERTMVKLIKNKILPQSERSYIIIFTFHTLYHAPIPYTYQSIGT